MTIEKILDDNNGIYYNIDTKLKIENLFLEKYLEKYGYEKCTFELYAENSGQQALIEGPSSYTVDLDLKMFHKTKYNDEDQAQHNITIKDFLGEISNEL